MTNELVWQMAYEWPLLSSFTLLLQNYKMRLYCLHFYNFYYLIFLLSWQNLIKKWQCLRSQLVCKLLFGYLIIIFCFKCLLSKKFQFLILYPRSKFNKIIKNCRFCLVSSWNWIVIGQIQIFFTFFLIYLNYNSFYFSVVNIF
jgi:hypothetical protein